MENLPALESNGFLVTVDKSGSLPVGRRCHLVSLPLSRETIFSLSDLEELISLLTDYQRPSGSASGSGFSPTSAATAPPRPSRVRKMFAMRACRSSIMIGRTLTHRQMEKVVRHMGEIDKPWNCPHGRPTMRHLCDLAAWDHLGWSEGGSERGDAPTDWAAYLRRSKG
jgi:DNA mismatch repair protein PMS2